MLFLNPWLLAGLGVAAVPVIIHLARRSAAKPIDWGAMRFLLDTVAQRRRRMEWEELLLMAARCLLLALAALAVARPFIPPDSQVPWTFVLPAGLLGVAVLGASFVPSSARWRWGARLAGIGLLGVVAVLVIFERQLNLRRFDASGRRDVALVIDASASMELRRGGASVFERAVEEAKRLVVDSPRGTAFVVILGGPAPEAKTSAPLTHRADVLGVLDSLKPVGGGFRAHEALGVATLALAEGTSPAKEIVVFTDAQRGGWRFDQPGAWDALEEAWGALAARPKLLVRDFGAPEGFRNVALGEFSMSRRVVGTDREVAIRAVVENTGEEALTPGAVTLEVDGVKAGEKPVGLLAAGQKAAVEFRHRFASAGPRVVALRIESGDDFPVDDGVERVAPVRRSLPVLLVDGNPSGSFFDRAAGYAALALAPAPGVIRGESAGERHLMDPRVVAAGALEAEDFEEAAVIVLADVPRLPVALAGKLAGRVAAGAGLLMLAGPRVEADFYNEWTGVDGPVVPGVLGGEGADREGVALAESTFAHESLGWIERGADLLTARVGRWRKVEELREGAVRGAAFANGDVFLASRSYGNGRTLLLGCALDARAGNLAARRGFVPFVHEVVGWCAGGGVDLNVEAAWSPGVFLGSRSGGLSAVYRRRNEARALLERVDPGIDFLWMDERPHRLVPRDHFTVSWRGRIVAPVTGEYAFSAEVDDRISVKVGDGAVWKAERGDGGLGKVRLEAGKAVAFEADFEEDGGGAYARLFWTPPGGRLMQPVPASAFLPVELPSAEFEVVDPRGLARKASIRSGRRGDELAIEGAAVPGVYRVKAGEGLEERFSDLGAEGLPVAVVRDEGEGRFEAWTQEDLELVRKRADLLLPGSVEDLLGVLEGKGFGRQVGRWLVWAALAFLVLESVLARWVSRSRRIAEETPVAFGDLFEAKGGGR